MSSWILVCIQLLVNTYGMNLMYIQTVINADLNFCGILVTSSLQNPHIISNGHITTIITNSHILDLLVTVVSTHHCLDAAAHYPCRNLAI